MMKDKTATLAELETAVNANCNAIKRESEMDLSKTDKSKAIIKELPDLLSALDHFLPKKIIFCHRPVGLSIQKSKKSAITEATSTCNKANEIVFVLKWDKNTKALNDLIKTYEDGIKDSV